MPLCKECKDEAEVMQKGPKPTAFEKWLNSLFNSEPKKKAANACDECDRCGV